LFHLVGVRRSSGS